MENEKLIPIEQLCVHYHIDFSFIHALSEYGLVEIETLEDVQYLDADQIKDIEKMIRLHFDLHINMEGIDAIFHLLQRVETLRNELAHLRNQFPLHEHDQDNIN